MSDEDRIRWDQRYGDGAYETRTHPSALLAQWIDRLPRGRALDVACGAGRNSLWLAKHGYSVTSVDISSVALDRLRRAADGLAVATVEVDLDHGLPELQGRFDLIIKMRFMNLSLLHSLFERLGPGGVLVCEILLQGGDASVGPSFGPLAPRFRAAPGVLLNAAKGLQVMYYDEGPVMDPDGRVVYLARLIGRRL